MIILQTGVPGSGKTASVVDMLMNDETYTHFTDKDGEKKERPLYVNGITDLKLPHNELTDDEIRVQPLQDFLPYGSLVVIDEAQRLFPPRSAGAKVPPYVEALATHRHHGLDIIFITQDPSFLDNFVRKLVGRHVHVRVLTIGRKLFEWTKCEDKPDSPGALSLAVERSFKLPKETFDMYKSAEVHTKPGRRLPRIFYFMILFLPALLGFGYWTYGRIHNRFFGEEEKPAAVVQESAQTVAAGGVNTSAPSRGASPFPAASDGRISQTLEPVMFVPSIPEKPESKPLYDGLRQVRQYERVAACIEGGKSGCTCYSDQATKLREIPEAKCRDYAQNGLPFDPFREPSREVFDGEVGQNEAAAGSSSGGSVLALSGRDKYLPTPKFGDGPSAQ